MSEQAEQQTQNPEMESAPQAQTMSNEELLARLETVESNNQRLESSNQRLLEESKTWKSKFQGMKSEAEQKETQKMQESNDFKGLYEKTQQELAEIRTAREQERADAMKAEFRYQVAMKAKDAEDVDLLVSAITNNKRESIAYSSESGKWEGVTDVINDLRKEKPFLFAKERVGLSNGRPGDNVPKPKSAQEMLAENPNAVLEKLLAESLK